MAGENLSLREAAEKRGITQLDFIQYARRTNLPYILENGKPLFPIDDKSIEKEKEEVKHFIYKKVQELRKPGFDGIHVVYSGFNVSFREKFPHIDVVKITQELSTEGFLRVRPAQGGAFMFINEIPNGEAHSPVEESQDPQFYNYPNKNYWRQRWHRFWREHIPVTDQTKVLCFGGFGDEILGYIKAGIKREKIIVVENSAQRRAYIGNHFPGVLLKEDITECVSGPKQKFDLVMFDTNGTFSTRNRKCLEMLLERELLQEKSALGVNVLTREHVEDQKEIYELSLAEGVLTSFNKIGVDSGDKKAFEQMKDYTTLVDLGITATILRLLRGKEAYSSEILLPFLFTEDKRFFQKKFGKDQTQKSIDNLHANEQIRQRLIERIQEYSPPEMNLVLILNAYASRPYFVDAMDRMSYESKNKNNRMFSDFFLLDRKPEIYAGLEQPLLKNLLEERMKLINFYQKLSEKSPKERKQMDREIQQGFQLLKQEYQSLFLPKNLLEREEIDAHKIIISQLEKNIPDENIYTLFSPALKKQQLAGYKAHFARYRDVHP